MIREMIEIIQNCITLKRSSLSGLTGQSSVWLDSPIKSGNDSFLFMSEYFSVFSVVNL
jgi:hypothetical protein